LKVIPAGRLPDVTLHVYGGVPPDAVNDVDGYATVTSPDGNDAGGVSDSGAGAMVTLFG
jgi:hypothetical protein